MPLGDVIGEFIVKPILEVVLYAVTYWTGYLFLKMTTFGTIRIAPLLSIDEKNRSKKKLKWYQDDWDIWLHRPFDGKYLKAESTIIVGIILWIITGLCVYLAVR